MCGFDGSENDCCEVAVCAPEKKVLEEAVVVETSAKGLISLSLAIAFGLTACGAKEAKEEEEFHVEVAKGFVALGFAGNMLTGALLLALNAAIWGGL